jgi:hypothetical protein
MYIYIYIYVCIYAYMHRSKVNTLTCVYMYLLRISILDIYQSMYMIIHVKNKELKSNNDKWTFSCWMRRLNWSPCPPYLSPTPFNLPNPYPLTYIIWSISINLPNLYPPTHIIWFISILFNVPNPPLNLHYLIHIN